MTRTIRILSLLAVMMVTTGQAWAETTDGVKYIDSNGVEQTTNGVTVLTGTETYLAGGWYICNSANLNYTGTITLGGDVHLILADGCTMNIGTSESSINGNGIIYSNQNGGQSLTIYGQANGTGALNVYVSGNYSNAILASDLTINGGNVTIDANGEAKVGIITIPGDITINGGTIDVTAIGNDAKGLYTDTNVTINGGTVRVTGTTDGIHIANGTIAINGGTIDVTAIGDDTEGYAINANYGYGTITLGWTNATDHITANSYSGTVSVKTGQAFITGDTTPEIVVGSVSNLGDLGGKTLLPAVLYIDANGSEQICSGFTVLDNTMNKLAAGWYVVNSDVDYTSDVTYSGSLYTDGYGDGDVNIILCDGATLTANGIDSYSKQDRLKIYGQSQGTGTANISETLTGCYSLTINGGTINANELDSYQGSIGINGGNITATIIDGTDQSVYINGGTVTATDKISAHYDIILNSGIVKAGSYKTASGNIKIMDSMTYTDGTTTYTGTLYDYQTPANGQYATLGDLNAAVGGKKLRPTVTTSYVDANGTLHENVVAFPLDDTDTTLGKDGTETWYICNSNLAFNHGLTLNGDVTLILADGCKMNVGNSPQAIPGGPYNVGIYAKGHFTVYGQEKGTGTLDICATDNNHAIYADAKDITFNGGRINATAQSNSIYNEGNITINGGQVTATGGTEDDDFGLKSDNGGIILGWTDAENDFIKASSYYGTVKTAANKPMIAYTPAATANDAEKRAVLIQGKEGGMELGFVARNTIAGKVLRPATSNDAVSVKYLDAKGTEKNTVTDNISANDIVYVLQGTEDVLGGDDEKTWYVAQGEINYTRIYDLTLNGDVHLILADGAKMTVEFDNGGSFYLFSGTSNENVLGLTIYGQSTGDNMGSLSVSTSNSSAISAYNDNGRASLTINGGQVTAKSSSKAISITSNSDTPYYATVTINGGQVTATGGSDGGYGIYAEAKDATVTINGGQVTAIGGGDGYGIYTSAINNANIILGWTNPTDFIKASSFKASGYDGYGTIKTVAGKRFIAYNMASEDDISANGIIGKVTEEATLDDGKINNIAGKTLRPLDGKFIALVDGQNITCKETPDFTLNIGGTVVNCYIYKKDDNVTLNMPNYNQSGVELEGVEGDAYITENLEVTISNDKATASYTMPDNDIVYSDVKYYNTGVKYMDWDDTQKKLVEKTTDANTKVYILTGGSANYNLLDGGWYVVNNYKDGVDAAYTGQLEFDDDAHLILGDDSKMTATCENNDAVYQGDTGDLTIYGQSKGNGLLSAASTTCIRGYGDSDIIINGGTFELTPTVDGGSGIVGDNVTIHGGSITVVSDYDFNLGIYGIYATGNSATNNVTITGGVFETVQYEGHFQNAILADGDITISGGQVNTNGDFGIFTNNGNISLSLTNGSDFIMANKYVASGNVKIPAGKALVIDGTTTILGGDADYVFGSGTNKTLDDIANQTLRASKDFPVSAGAQYAVICQNQGDWKITDPDVKMYVPTGNIILNATTGAYEMELREVTDGGIPNGMPIIVAKEGGLGGIPVVGTTATEANTIETNYTNANPSPTFFAADGEKTLNELIKNALGAEVDPTDYVAFTLIGGKLVAASNSGNVVNAGTCIFVVSKFDVLRMVQGTYTAPASSAPGIVIDLGEVTGVKEVNASLEVKDDSFYTLDGRRISKPTKKGLYINKGKKVVK